MDMVGWYTNSGIDAPTLVRLLVAGGVVQAIPRLTILPALAHSLSRSQMAQRFAAALLLLTAVRNTYVGLTLRSTGKEERRSLLPVLPLVVRVLLVELTDLCANSDSFLAKALATDDEMHIGLSSLVTLFVPRCLALLMLSQARPQAAPMRAMLLVSGFTLLALTMHIMVPTVPDLPTGFKLMMPCALYAYVLYLAGTTLLEPRQRPEVADC